MIHSSKSKFNTISTAIFKFYVKWHNTRNAMAIIFKIKSIWILMKFKFCYLTHMVTQYIGPMTQAPQQDEGRYTNRNVISEKSRTLMTVRSKFHPWSGRKLTMVPDEKWNSAPDAPHVGPMNLAIRKVYAHGDANIGRAIYYIHAP